MYEPPTGGARARVADAFERAQGHVEGLAAALSDAATAHMAALEEANPPPEEPFAWTVEFPPGEVISSPVTVRAVIEDPDPELRVRFYIDDQLVDTDRSDNAAYVIDPRDWSDLDGISVLVEYAGQTLGEVYAIDYEPPSPPRVGPELAVELTHGRIFGSSGSCWTVSARSLGIAEDSTELVADFHRGLRAKGTWINGSVEPFKWSTRVALAPPGAPRYVVATPGKESLARDLAAAGGVPIPDDFSPDVEDDGHGAIIQFTDHYTVDGWDFWRLRREGDQWLASYGGVMQNIRQGDGTMPNAGARASGLPMFGGLIYAGDAWRVLRGEQSSFGHALAIGIPAKWYGWTAPAKRTDQRDDSKDLGEPASRIPMGQRFTFDFRSPAELEQWLTANEVSHLTAALARDIYTFGAIVADRAGSVTAYAQIIDEPIDNPWPELLDGKRPSHHMGELPWDHLVACASPVRVRRGG